ncbi:YbfB/YjiJ family MFS transporter [Sinorhizobium sp. RAC02]|uniref:YbfB/YjiJ family MFS transporter n=1 Tax=Sinorhizobium sp. RAC02 TaxID=1842534 RepID=UPI00256FC0A4|nr:YbfB/YjiJ family MFS transporter [Sinorhizobium sp. RAC02]
MMQRIPALSREPVRAAIAGAIAMAVAMGLGRFFYTPVLPGMMAGLGLNAADAGIIAAANFAGYLLGAVLAAYGWAAGLERRLAIGALVSTVLLLLVMALISDVAALSVVRFLAGLASAFAMIFTSGIVLSIGLRHQDARVQMAHFSGVGLGIAVSAVLVYLLSLVQFPAIAAWRADWLAGAALGAIGLAAVMVLLPRPEGGASGLRELPIVWTRPLVALTLSYGLFGIGYVVTATFIVAIAREGAESPLLECLIWLVTGASAAISLVAWKPVVRRYGVAVAYLAAILVEMVGVAVTVTLPFPASALIGGALLGLTFIVITAYGLQLGRVLASESPRQVLALMTAAFGVGQILGPLGAGFLAARTGSYVLPSLAAAGILLLAAAITVAGGALSIKSR